MEIVIAEEVQKEIRGEVTRMGATPRQWILSEDGEDGFSFRLVRSEYQPGEKAFQTPRHHHAFQQFRWAQTGSLNYGPDQFVEEGDIAYFPRGAFYGPQVRDHGVGLTLQFGFGYEMLGGKDAPRIYREGVAKLKAKGKIEDGVFVDIDPVTGAERRRDPAEAVIQEVTGTNYTIPAPGYDAAILMHPKSYNYYTIADGVEIKHLGAFYDHPGPNADVRVSIVRFSEGGTYMLTSERAQVAWTTAPGLRIGERVYPELTCLFSPRGEEAALSAADEFELYVIEFPRLS